MSLSESQGDILNKFCSLLHEFLQQIESVFPECTGTKKLILQYDIGITHAPTESIASLAKNKLIEAWSKHMTPFYERCRAKDESTIKEITASHDVFQGLDLWNKWMDPDLDEGTHNCIWDYINNLNRFCQMYTMCSSVPDGMRTSIEKVAKTLEQQLGVGSAGIPAFNSDTFMKIAQAVSAELKPADMENFAKQVDPKMLQSLVAGLIPPK